MVNPQNRIPDHVRTQVEDLARQGVSRNKIAEQLGISASSVYHIATKAGIRFNGAIPAAMVEARAINVKERQVAARERHYSILEHEQAQVLDVYEKRAKWTTRVKTSGGGERFEEVGFIPVEDKRNAASAFASHLSTIKNLAPLDTENTTAAADSVVDSLLAGFQSIANAATKTGPVGDESKGT